MEIAIVIMLMIIGIIIEDLMQSKNLINLLL